MRRPFLVAGCAATIVVLAGLASAVIAARTAVGPVRPSLDVTAERVPVLLELFTSEGCSSCPPADDVLTKLVTLQPVPGAQIIALGEHVDYWDHLGWRDPFSSAAFSARQSDYASKVFRSGNIYTPQMVVDGREELVGSDYRAATAAVARAARLPQARRRITLDVNHDSLETQAQIGTLVEPLGTTPLSGVADVFVAIAEDGVVTKVRRGENGGRQLTHSAAVRSLTSVGAIPADARPWSATTTVSLSPDWNLSRTRVIAFVQERATKRILGATSANLAAHQ